LDRIPFCRQDVIEILFRFTAPIPQKTKRGLVAWRDDGGGGVEVWKAVRNCSSSSSSRSHLFGDILDRATGEAQVCQQFNQPPPPPSELKVYHASLISICMQTDAAQHRNKNILPSAIIGLPKKQRRPTEPKKDPRPPFVLKYPIINLPSQPGGKKRSVAPLRHYERVLNPTNTALSSSLLSPPLSSDYCARDS
jgi:hypothetical protein